MVIEGAPTPAVPAEGVLARRKQRVWYIDLWFQLFKTKPLAAFGLILMMFFVVMGLFATWVAPEGVNEPHTERLIEQEDFGGVFQAFRIPGPSWQHPLGLDAVGRDFLSRIIHGGRTSALVGLGVVGLSVALGTLIGVYSAWYGGTFDMVVQRIVDGWLTFPQLPVLITLVAVFPPHFSDVPLLGSLPYLKDMPIAGWAMFKIILAIGILWTPWYARVLRSSALVIKESQYVDAANAMGATSQRIVLTHIVPNVMAAVLTLATLSLGSAILAETTLSFLGYGVPPPNPTWGGMLTMGGVSHLYSAPWLAIFPGIAISLMVLGINLLGDGLRDLLDPRMRGQQ